MRQTRSTHISPPTSKSPSKYIRKKISKNLYTQVYRLIPRYTHRIAESLQIFILYLTCVCVLSEKDGFSVETRSMCWKEKGDHQSPKARMGAATCDVRANQQFLLLLLFICFFLCVAPSSLSLYERWIAENPPSTRWVSTAFHGPTSVLHRTGILVVFVRAGCVVVPHRWTCRITDERLPEVNLPPLVVRFNRNRKTEQFRLDRFKALIERRNLHDEVDALVDDSGFGGKRSIFQRLISKRWCLFIEDSNVSDRLHHSWHRSDKKSSGMVIIYWREGGGTDGLEMFSCYFQRWKSLDWSERARIHTHVLFLPPLVYILKNKLVIYKRKGGRGVENNWMSPVMFIVCPCPPAGFCHNLFHVSKQSRPTKRAGPCPITPSRSQIFPKIFFFVFFLFEFLFWLFLFHFQSWKFLCFLQGNSHPKMAAEKKWPLSSGVTVRHLKRYVWDKYSVYLFKKI